MLIAFFVEQVPDDPTLDVEVLILFQDERTSHPLYHCPLDANWEMLLKQ